MVFTLSANNFYYNFFLQGANYYEKEILDNPTETAYYNRISGHEIGWKAAQIVQSYMLAREIQPSAEHDNRIKDYHKWLEEDSKWSTTIENCGLNNPEYYLANWQDDATWLVGYYLNVYKITKEAAHLDRAFNIYKNADDYWGYHYELTIPLAGTVKFRGLAYQNKVTKFSKPPSRSYVGAHILVGLELFRELKDISRKREVMELVRGYYLFMETVMKASYQKVITAQNGYSVERGSGLYYYGAATYNFNNDTRLLSSIYIDASGNPMQSPMGALGTQLSMGAVHYLLADILEDSNTSEYVNGTTSTNNKYPIIFSTTYLRSIGKQCTDLIFDHITQEVDGKLCFINTGIDTHTQGYALPMWLKYAYPRYKEQVKGEDKDPRSIIMNTASLIAVNNRMSLSAPRYIDVCWYDNGPCSPSSTTSIQVGDWNCKQNSTGTEYPTSRKSLNICRETEVRIEDHASALMFVLAAAYIQKLESLSPLYMLPAIN